MAVTFQESMRCFRPTFLIQPILGKCLYQIIQITDKKAIVYPKSWHRVYMSNFLRTFMLMQLSHHMQRSKCGKDWIKETVYEAIFQVVRPKLNTLIAHLQNSFCLISILAIEFNVLYTPSAMSTTGEYHR